MDVHRDAVRSALTGDADLGAVRWGEVLLDAVRRDEARWCAGFVRDVVPVLCRPVRDAVHLVEVRRGVGSGVELDGLPLARRRGYCPYEASVELASVLGFVPSQLFRPLMPGLRKTLFEASRLYSVQLIQPELLCVRLASVQLCVRPALVQP